MQKEAHEKQVPLRFRYMTPLYNYACGQIRKKTGMLPDCLFSGAAGPLKNLFYEQLNLLAESTFCLFFNETMPKYSDKERIEYIEQCSISQLNDLWSRILLTYPVLKHLIMQWITDFTTHVITMCQRLEADLNDISEMLGSTPGRIRMIDEGNSDIHNGRCVHIVSFENGMKIVYKPRSLKLDGIWQDYLQDMAKKSGIGPFRVPWILQRKEYGYEEYIERKPVNGLHGFSEYFHRCGFLLGVAYALQASDLHAENMIAYENCPVLVDLETGVRACGNTVFSDIKNPVEKRYQSDSVLRTNLLPFLTMGRTITPGDDAFTAKKDGLKNLPYKGDDVRSAKDYVQELTEGFCLAYDTIQKHGITKNFSDCSVRFLIRNTSSYRNMQKIIYTPEYLKDTICFEYRLDDLMQLYQKAGVNTNNGFFHELLEKEKEALRQGYIPKLTLNMQDNWNGDNTTSLAELLEGRPAHMNAQDKARQCKRIKISLNESISADNLYFSCLRRRDVKPIPFMQIKAIMHSRVNHWENRLACEKTPEGIVVCLENGRYYLTHLPWNMMEGIPGLLPAFAAWHRLSGNARSLSLFMKIIKKLYRQLKKTDLKLYKPGLSEGLEGILCMVLLLRQISDVIWIDKIYSLITPYVDTELYRVDIKDESTLDTLFDRGLFSGMDGIDFPSFFKGEGGWLYSMLRKAAPDKLPPVRFNAAHNRKGKQI